MYLKSIIDSTLPEEPAVRIARFYALALHDDARVEESD